MVFHTPKRSKRMNKTLVMVVACLLAGTIAGNATGDGKKKKKKADKTEQTAQPVALSTPSDSVSYAAGTVATMGLQEFIEKEYGVDSAYMASFVEGFKEALDNSGDKAYAARMAGTQVAHMVEKRILPQNKTQFEGTDCEINESVFHRAFFDALAGDTTVMTTASAGEYFKATLDDQKAKKEAAYKDENAQWLVANAANEGVKTTESGLQYKVVTMGEGALPQKTDKVKVRYEGKLIDGTVFDSSYKRKPDTSEFRADQVIKGWTEALMMMPVGSTWELYIPQELGYGARQAGKIKPYSTLIFKVELVEIVSGDDADEPAKKPKISPVKRSITNDTATSKK